MKLEHAFSARRFALYFPVDFLITFLNRFAPGYARPRTSEDESNVVEPRGMQERIDEAAAKVEMGRCFVRASNTEDVVRVYGEGMGSEKVKEMVEEVKGVVREFCGSVMESKL